MTELRGKGTEKLKADLGIVFDEHTWVAEELEKRLYCQGCRIAVANR